MNLRKKLGILVFKVTFPEDVLLLRCEFFERFRTVIFQNTSGRILDEFLLVPAESQQRK